MTGPESTTAHRREPLYEAAELLERAAAEAVDGPAWRRDIRHAVRASTLALERHLDSLAGGIGLGADITTEHPRLLHALEHLEAAQARLLVDLWEAQDAGSGTVDPGLSRRLRALATQLRHAADDEVDLLYESLNEPMGQD